MGKRFLKFKAEPKQLPGSLPAALQKLKIMAYKWRPSAAQRKQFAQNMQDEDFRNDYEAKKAERATKKRASSKFDYATAGGMYVPTKNQYNFVMNYSENLTAKQQGSFDQITYGYSCKEKVHHDHIHIVNEMIRNAG